MGETIISSLLVEETTTASPVSRTSEVREAVSAVKEEGTVDPVTILTARATRAVGSAAKTRAGSAALDKEEAKGDSARRAV